MASGWSFCSSSLERAQDQLAREVDLLVAERGSAPGLASSGCRSSRLHYAFADKGLDLMDMLMSR